jgi:hypothetical protein
MSTTFGGTDPDTSVPGELMSQVRQQMASNVALAQCRGTKLIEARKLSRCFEF